MHASPAASPQAGFTGNAQPSAPHSSMHSSPVAAPQTGFSANTQPSSTPTPGPAEPASATAGTKSPEVAALHQPQHSWQQPEAAAPSHHSGLAHKVSVWLD